VLVQRLEVSVKLGPMEGVFLHIDAPALQILMFAPQGLGMLRQSRMFCDEVMDDAHIAATFPGEVATLCTV
jgi:hypothetical protein